MNTNYCYNNNSVYIYCWSRLEIKLYTYCLITVNCLFSQTPPRFSTSMMRKWSSWLSRWEACSCWKLVWMTNENPSRFEGTYSTIVGGILYINHNYKYIKYIIFYIRVWSFYKWLVWKACASIKSLNLLKAYSYLTA